MSPSTADVVARIYKMGGFEVRNERARWEGRIQENHRRIVERGREALAEILVIRQSRRRVQAYTGFESPSRSLKSCQGKMKGNTKKERDGQGKRDGKEASVWRFADESWTRRR